MNTDSQWSKQETCFSLSNQVRLAVNHNTSAALLVNEFDVRSVLHGQMSLAAVNHIYAFHEVINGCNYLKIH